MNTRYRLELGHCLSFLDSLAPGSIGAAIVDPPYASGSPEAKLSNQTPDTKYTQSGQKQRWADFEGDQLDQRSFLRFAITWLGLVKRSVKRGGYVMVFIDWRQLPTMTDAIQIAGLTWRSLFVWDKGEGTRCPGRGRFRHQCEYLVVASNGKLPTSKDAPFGAMPGCLRVPVLQRDKHHLTGKPTELLRRLVKVCSEGESILDPFAGSGTTGVAALLEGRRFVGCELSPVYHAIATQRLEAASSGVIIPSQGPNASHVTPPPTKIVPNEHNSLAI